MLLNTPNSILARQIITNPYTFSEITYWRPKTSIQSFKVTEQIKDPGRCSGVKMKGCKLLIPKHMLHLCVDSHILLDPVFHLTFYKERRKSFQDLHMVWKEFSTAFNWECWGQSLQSRGTAAVHASAASRLCPHNGQAYYFLIRSFSVLLNCKCVRTWGIGYTKAVLHLIFMEAFARLRVSLQKTLCYSGIAIVYIY